MPSKKVIGFVAAFLVVLSLLFLNTRKEFRIEEYSFVPPQHVEEYLAIQASLPEGEFLTKFTPTYASDAPTDENLEGVQCPIPMSDRVPNRTGIQCVWASIEMIGRWAEEPKLMNPPLTSRSECKSYSSPSLAASQLKKLGVKFEQSYQDRDAGISLIKKAMAEGRGCLWGVPGHAMVLIHYDEVANVVKWVDNSDSRLAVQTTTVDRFKQRWDSWVLVVYADNDIIPVKLNRDGLARKIPIWDRSNPQGQYPKDYVPIPRRENIFDIPPVNQGRY